MLISRVRSTAISSRGSSLSNASLWLCARCPCVVAAPGRSALSAVPPGVRHPPALFSKRTRFRFRTSSGLLYSLGQLNLAVNAGRGRPGRRIGKSACPWPEHVAGVGKVARAASSRDAPSPGRPSVEERKQTLRCKPDVGIRGGPSPSIVAVFPPIHSHPPAFQTKNSPARNQARTGNKAFPQETTACRQGIMEARITWADGHPPVPYEA